MSNHIFLWRTGLIGKHWYIIFSEWIGRGGELLMIQAEWRFYYLKMSTKWKFTESHWWLTTAVTVMPIEEVRVREDEKKKKNEVQINLLPEVTRIKMSRKRRRTNWDRRKGNGWRDDREMGWTVFLKYRFEGLKRTTHPRLFRDLEPSFAVLSVKKKQLISCSARLTDEVARFQVETAIITGRTFSCWNESVMYRLKSKNSMFIYS